MPPVITLSYWPMTSLAKRWGRFDTSSAEASLSLPSIQHLPLASVATATNSGSISDVEATSPHRMWCATVCATVSKHYFSIQYQQNWEIRLWQQEDSKTYPEEIVGTRWNSLARQVRRSPQYMSQPIMTPSSAVVSKLTKSDRKLRHFLGGISWVGLVL